MQKGIVYENVLTLSKRVQDGLFNIILIFGPTRSGKSTLAFQIAKTICQEVGVPFNDDNIHFSAAKLVEWLNGQKKQVGILDEGAFEMKAEDWHNAASKNLRKYIDTAAKFNQTIIVCIPKIKELHSSLVSNYHSRGFRTQINFKQNKKTGEMTWRPGNCKGYKGKKLFNQWEFEKKLNWDEDTMYKLPCTIGPYSYGKDLSFMDEVAYNKKKEEAIAQLQLDDKDENKTNALKLGKLCLYVHTNEKMPYEKIGKLIDSHTNTVGTLVRLAKSEL